MSSGNSTSQPQAKEISLKLIYLQTVVWYRYLLSKWLVIVLMGIIGAGLGFLYAYLKKPVYTATTTFVLEDDKSRGGLGSIAGLASIAGVDLATDGGGIFQGDNILELYKSRKMIEKTLLSSVSVDGKKQLLIDRYIDFNKLRDKWAEKPALKDINFSQLAWPTTAKANRLQDSIIGTIVEDINKRNLSVSKLDKKLSIIRADVVSKDEIFSKAFNEEIVKNVNDFYVQTKTKKSADNVSILAHKTDSVRRVMNGAIFTAATVTDATPNLNPTRSAQRVAPTQRAQFSVETNKAVLGELIKNLEMSKITLLKETPLIQVIDEPIYPLKKDKSSKLISLVLGGILAGMITVFLLIARRVLSGLKD